MNEKLVAFRDTQGRVGILERYYRHPNAEAPQAFREKCAMRSYPRLERGGMVWA